MVVKIGDLFRNPTIDAKVSTVQPGDVLVRSADRLQPSVRSVFYASMLRELDEANAEVARHLLLEHPCSWMQGAAVIDDNDVDKFPGVKGFKRSGERVPSVPVCNENAASLHDYLYLYLVAPGAGMVPTRNTYLDTYFTTTGAHRRLTSLVWCASHGLYRSRPCRRGSL
jgi:hypothetical protein